MPDTDTATLDAMTRGFVTALLWTNAQPHRPYEVDGDDEHGWTIVGPDGPMPDEKHRTGVDALAVADRLNAEDDDYTGESGGLQHSEPTPELVVKARELCARFLAANADDVTAHMYAFGDPDGGHPGEYVGHTFYLDAAGSGVSFTDRAWRDDDNLTPVCERLSVSADSFAEVEHLDAYELADGRVDIG
jgi:hypothetical protein